MKLTYSRHSGFLIPSLGLYAAIGAAVVIVWIGGYARIQSARLEASEANVKAFKQAGEIALQYAKRKDDDNANRIKTAITDRDTALARLRKSTLASRVSYVPIAASASSQVCGRASIINGALASFGQAINRRLADAQRDAVEGDAAEVDAKALVDAWPK